MADLAALELDRFLAQAELLGRLIENPAWEAWTDLLRAFRTKALENLAIEKDASEIRFWQGAAGALGEILERPGRIVAEAAEIQRNEEESGKGIRPDLRAALAYVGSGVDHDGNF